MTDELPYGIAGLGWTYEGHEVQQHDPNALAGYPTPEFVDRAALLLAENQMLDGMPTSDQLRWALGIFAITEGSTRRGEDPTSRQVADRLLRYEERWQPDSEATWPERFHESDEQRANRENAIAIWRANDGGESD